MNISVSTKLSNNAIYFGSRKRCSYSYGAPSPSTPQTKRENRPAPILNKRKQLARNFQENRSSIDSLMGLLPQNLSNKIIRGLKESKRY